MRKTVRRENYLLYICNREWMTRFISFTFHADQGTDNSKRDCRGHVRLFINAVLFRFTCMNILCEIMYENRLC